MTAGLDPESNAVDARVALILIGYDAALRAATSPGSTWKT